MISLFPTTGLRRSPTLAYPRDTRVGELSEIVLRSSYARRDFGINHWFNYILFPTVALRDVGGGIFQRGGSQTHRRRTVISQLTLLIGSLSRAVSRTLHHLIYKYNQWFSIVTQWALCIVFRGNLTCVGTIRSTQQNCTIAELAGFHTSPASDERGGSLPDLARQPWPPRRAALVLAALDGAAIFSNF